MPNFKTAMPKYSCKIAKNSFIKLAEVWNSIPSWYIKKFQKCHLATGQGSNSTTLYLVLPLESTTKVFIIVNIINFKHVLFQKSKFLLEISIDIFSDVNRQCILPWTWKIIKFSINIPVHKRLVIYFRAWQKGPLRVW